MNLVYVLIISIICLSKISLASLPFVTDDAHIAKKNELVIETFSEHWITQNAQGNTIDVNGQYLGLSYGLGKNIEISIAGMASMGNNAVTTSNLNPIFQIKTMLARPQNQAIPSLVLSIGYMPKRGNGAYYDNSEDSYVLLLATSHFLDDFVIVHANIGDKNSTNISEGYGSIHRPQLSLALEIGIVKKEFKFFVEGFNGAPNSPRDSPGMTNHVGFKYEPSSHTAYYILYGYQEQTFHGYDSMGSPTYNQSHWIQAGIRKAIDDFL